MPFIPVNLDDVKEPKPAPEGRYRVQITGAKVTKASENSKHPGHPQLQVTVGLPDEDSVPTFSHYISFPHPDDEPNSANFKMLLLKRFLHAFDLPYDPKGIDTEKLCMEMVGRSTEMAVTQQASNKDPSAMFNALVLPRLPDEEDSKPTSGRRRR